MKMTTAEKLQTAWHALERLAKLGNGDSYGNSDGNTIAQQALQQLDKAVQPTGDNVNYYIVAIEKPKRLPPYEAEAEDIIEVLGMSFAEGNVFKALWRSCAESALGLHKPGANTDGVYDAEKMVYYSQRVLAQRKKLMAVAELPLAKFDKPLEKFNKPTEQLQPTATNTMKNFAANIFAMNRMYMLPASLVPTVFPGEPLFDRMPKFMKTMRDEIEEGDALYAASIGGKAEDIDLITDVADLLGDIVVYAFSEATKYGIPMDKVLEIIMLSNASKLGADGKPIYNEDGKFMKGPNYWKPEKLIKAMLETHIREAKQA
jgi:hypothetical protein